MNIPCFASLFASLALTPFLAHAASSDDTGTVPENTPAANAPAPPPEEAGYTPGIDLPIFQGIRLITPLKVGAFYRLPSDIKNGPGELYSWTYSAEVAAHFASETDMLYGALDYRYVDYHFRDVTAPFNDIEALRLYIRYEHVFDRQWSLFLDASGVLASETDAHIGDGATGRLGGGVKYTLSPDLSFYVGAQVVSRLSNDASIFPYIGLEWQIDRHWSLNVTNGLVVSYDVYGDRSLRFDLGCTYQSSSYRLVNDTVGGVARTRALETQEVPLALSVTQEFGKMSYVRASVAGILLSKYKFRSGGARVGEFETDPTVVFALEAGIRF